MVAIESFVVDKHDADVIAIQAAKCWCDGSTLLMSMRHSESHAPLCSFYVQTKG